MARQKGKRSPVTELSIAAIRVELAFSVCVRARESLIKPGFEGDGLQTVRKFAPFDGGFSR
jgi:hypothetical protein